VQDVAFAEFGSSGGQEGAVGAGDGHQADFTGDVQVARAASGQFEAHFDADEGDFAATKFVNGVEVAVRHHFIDAAHAQFGARDGHQPQLLVDFGVTRVVHAGDDARHFEQVAGDTRGDDVGVVGGAGGDEGFGVFYVGLLEGFSVEAEAVYHPTFEFVAQAGGGICVVMVEYHHLMSALVEQPGNL